MSYFTDQLWDLVERLNEDGYPTALIERCAERMEQLEDEVIRLNRELEDARTVERSNN